MGTIAKIVVGIIILIPVLYIGSCTVISHQREHGLAQVKNGDSEQQVIQVMGQPADRETAGGNRVAKYGAPECKAPCAQRLWYPNPISPAGEAWSVDLDVSGHVIATDHIVSP
jgi:hypothetical protein